MEGKEGRRRMEGKKVSQKKGEEGEGERKRGDGGREPVDGSVILKRKDFLEVVNSCFCFSVGGR